MRRDYAVFQERGVEIVALGPDNLKAFERYWTDNDLPFIGCADPKSRVADRYYQEVNLFKLGRMPAIFVIDREGFIRYSHYGSSMSDIPSNKEILQVLDEIDS